MATIARIFVALSLAVTAGQLVAQRTWIVDPAGGPGVFSDIQPAVNAAASGDRILIRSGGYNRFTVSGKALQLVGASRQGVTVTGPAEFLAVPAGTATTVRSLTLQVDPQVLGPLLRVAQCVGYVLVEDVDVQASFVDVQSTALFSANGLRAPGMRCFGSAVQLNDCAFAGSIAALRSSLSIVACTARGADGRPATSQSAAQPPSPGLDSADSDITIAADSQLLAGQPAAGTILAAPAIEAQRGRLEIHPTVVLSPSAGAPAIRGSASVQRIAGSAVEARDAIAGQPVQGQVHGPAGQAFLVGLSLPAIPVATPFAAAWLDLAQVVIVDLGVFPMTGSTALQLSVPAGVPSGLAATLQPVSTLPLGSITLGEPVTIVLR